MNKQMAGTAVALVFAVCSVLLISPHAEESNERPSSEDIPAARAIADPYPAFNGIGVDATNDVVVMSDPNRKSLLLYGREAISRASNRASIPRGQIIGPETYIGMVAAVALDPQRREIYTANNDIEDSVVVMSYDSAGNAKPARIFSVPHQAWGLALSSSRREIAVSVEIQNALVFYRRGVKGVEAPLRVIRGANTGMADPHGVYWDEVHQEIAVANHGNFRGIMGNTGGGCLSRTSVQGTVAFGQFQPPSVTIYSASASGDEKPLRTIQGPKTELDWPMGIAEDPVHDTIVVANNGDNSILIFARTRGGDVRPVRSIRGERTGIRRPMGVALDAENNEIWVSNYGDHSALAFSSGADGNVLPKRIIRSAPPGAPTPGFGNPMALAYDSRREEILVPN